MFCLLVVFVRLSVPVQVIDWKDSSPNDLCVDGDVIPYTHSPCWGFTTGMDPTGGPVVAPGLTPTWGAAFPDRGAKAKIA